MHNIQKVYRTQIMIRKCSANRTYKRYKNGEDGSVGKVFLRVMAREKSCSYVLCGSVSHCSIASAGGEELEKVGTRV